MLEKSRKWSVTPVIKNGQTEAVEIVDDFLNGLECRITSSNQKAGACLRTTHEQVNPN